MKKILPIYIYGTIIIVVGIFLLFSENNIFNMINLKIGIPLTVGGVFALIAAFSRQRKQVQFAYHEMHAMAMLVYGISIIVFCNTFEKLISLTEFLFLFYMLSEIIFCSWLFNLGKKVVFKILIVRLLLGLAIGVGTVIAMNYSTFTLKGFGILFIIVGLNILLYVPIMKVEELSEI